MNRRDSEKTANLMNCLNLMRETLLNVTNICKLIQVYKLFLNKWKNIKRSNITYEVCDMLITILYKSIEFYE